MTPQKNQCLKNWQPTTKSRRVAAEIAVTVIKRHAMTAILLAGMIALSSEFFAK